jgi:predicted secreted Zn-dependent protease
MTPVISILRRCVLIIMSVVLGIWVLPAQPAVDVNDQVEHYMIEGATPPDLRREMSTKGPQGKEGRRFDGHTRWYVSWRYQYKNIGGGCAIASVTTKVKSTITLPQWRNESRADGTTRALWSRYLAALELHEQGHRRHGVDAAHEIDLAIAAMPSAGSCDALGTNANALGMRILQKYQQRDLDYDRDTNHGATQGARFP